MALPKGNEARAFFLITLGILGMKIRRTNVPTQTVFLAAVISPSPSSSRWLFFKVGVDFLFQKALVGLTSGEIY